MATVNVLDVNLTEEDTQESLLAVMTSSTIKMFKLLLPDENRETINSIVCSTMVEIFNRIDPRKDSWVVHIRNNDAEE